MVTWSKVQYGIKGGHTSMMQRKCNKGGVAGGDGTSATRVRIRR